jgi:hypothetical protein
MDSQMLLTLERAVEPYIRSGYTITTQSERSITLTSRPKKFNYVAFIFALLLFWPVAIIYIILFNNRRDKSVCVRVTSTGNIEETGYTLVEVNRERRRDRIIGIITIATPILIVLAFILLRMWTRSLLPNPP